MGDLVVVASVGCAGAGVWVVGLAATLDDDDGGLVAVAVFPRCL